MNSLKNLGKYFGVYLIVIFIFSLFLNLFYYFNLISDTWLMILSFIIPLLFLFLISIALGKKATKRGFLEGLKLGGCVIFFYFLLYVLGFQGDISWKLALFYLIFLLTSVLGSMIGINKKA